MSGAIREIEDNSGRTADDRGAPSRAAQTSRMTIPVEQETMAFLKAMATVLKYNRPEDYAHDLVARGLQEDAHRIGSAFEPTSSKKGSGRKARE